MEFENYEAEEYVPVREKPPKSPLRFIPYAVIAVLVIVLMMLLPKVLPMLSPSLTYYVYPKEAEFIFEREIMISGGDYTVYIELPIPTDIANGSLQKIVSVVHEESMNLVYREVNKAGYTWMNWSGGGHISWVKIRYHVIAKTVWWNIAEHSVGTVEDIPEGLKSAYCHDEWLITPSNPEISALAHQLADDEYSVYDKIKAIYDYVTENIVYEAGRSGEPKSAIDVLHDKSGDCDEQGMLLCSLMRAVGIPSWLEIGALYSGDDKVGGHAWVGVYIPTSTGGGWVNIDVANHQFMLRDCYRFSEWVDVGNDDLLKDYYNAVRVKFFGQKPQISETWKLISITESGEKVRVPAGSGKQGLPIGDFIAPVAITVAVFLYTIRRRLTTE
ncbi:MAG: hypothetical protein DRN20_03655 [Thermoplasmata archaeon]|nr:MAG: hypothetical protein DRN20_03655 [Thermoplasmata archaeon]